MTERTMRLWIGLFVLLSLVLFGGLILLFGSAPTLFKRSNLYQLVDGLLNHRSGIGVDFLYC